VSDTNGQAAGVFGLSKQQLWPVVEELAGERVADFDVSVDHELAGHRGYGAQKLIPTFHYTTQSGRTGQGRSFVKWFHEARQHEAHHYQVLASLGAPLPKLYGHLPDVDGREMIFLELLDPIDDRHPFDRFVQDDDLFGRFVLLAAAFNALGPTGEYAASLRRFDHGEVDWRMRDGAEAAQELCRRSKAGELGDELAAFCAAREGELLGLGDWPARLTEEIPAMPLGLGHGDLYPDSVATRPATGEMLMVDLEGVSHFPRFWDVARWLGPPLEVGVPDCPHDRYAAAYLAEYERCGGPRVAIEQFQAEAETLAIASALMMFPFALDRAIDGQVDWTDDCDEGRRIYRQQLYGRLDRLLALRPR